MLYQSESETNRSNGREGGVAIFVKKNIAATQAKAFHSEGGQWIRVTTHGQTRKFVRCRTLVLTFLLSGLTGVNN